MQPDKYLCLSSRLQSLSWEPVRNVPPFQSSCHPDYPAVCPSSLELCIPQETLDGLHSWVRLLTPLPQTLPLCASLSLCSDLWASRLWREGMQGLDTCLRAQWVQEEDRGRAHFASSHLVITGSWQAAENCQSRTAHFPALQCLQLWEPETWEFC